MVPKPKPRGVHHSELAGAVRVVDAAESAATNDGDHHGEYDKTEDGTKNKLFADTNSDLPENGGGQAENCRLGRLATSSLHKMGKRSGASLTEHIRNDIDNTRHPGSNPNLAKDDSCLAFRDDADDAHKHAVPLQGGPGPGEGSNGEDKHNVPKDLEALDFAPQPVKEDEKVELDEIDADDIEYGGDVEVLQASLAVGQEVHSRLRLVIAHFCHHVQKWDAALYQC